MAKADSLKRLGGGRWQTHDGRFQIEPQSGTWMMVDTTQTNEFGLPLVRGPFGSLRAAKEAVEAMRTQGPVESPLADRIERSSGAAAPATLKAPKATKTKGRPEVEPAPPPAPPEPKWIRDLRPADRSKAKDLVARLEALGFEDTEDVARAEIAQGLPAVARLALERRLVTAIESTDDPSKAVRAVIDAMVSGEDADLGVAWRLVDDRGRPIKRIDLIK
jgi:hypothetical protein